MTLRQYLRVLLSAGTLILIGCASAHSSAANYPRKESHAIAPTESSSLEKVVAKYVKLHPDQSGFKLISKGSDALLMRIAMIEAAERSVDLQYYIIQDDDSGKLLLEAIMKAADRGVRIRILVDDITLKKSDPTWTLLDVHPNISIRIFNPLFTWDDALSRIGSLFNNVERFTKRMHNKVFVADNQLALIGGRNLGDAYFDNSPDSNFRDIDLLAVGPIVSKISGSFDRYWNGKEAYPISDVISSKRDPEDVLELRKALKAHWQEAAEKGVLQYRPTLVKELQKGRIPLIWANAELAADSPEKVEQPTGLATSKPDSHIEAISSQAKHEFIIVSPYFVPGEDGVRWIKSMLDRGVNVRILTNSLASTDVVSVHTGYRRYRKELLADGAEMYEMEPIPGKLPPPGRFSKSSRASLHTKMYVIDRSDVVIGTMNMDPRSAQLNTEIALIIHSVPLAQQVGKVFDHAVSPYSSYHVVLNGSDLEWKWRQDGQDMYEDDEPRAGLWRRFKATVYSILPLEDEL